MSALPLPISYLTPEEYLALERAADTKSEYWQGQTFAMAGASTQHTIIGANTLAELVMRLRGRSCTVHTNDLRVKVTRAGLYTYPDVAVVCGKAEFDDEHEDALLNPTVLIEVLSPTTEAYDRGAKFKMYRTLASLADYLLIAQDKPLIEVFTRQPGDRWLLSTYDGLEAIAAIPSIGCVVRLADVYDKVAWPTAEAQRENLRLLREPNPRYAIRP